MWEKADAEREDWPLPSWVEGDSLAPFVPSQIESLHEAFEAAKLCDKDTLIDLGCGDGRVVVEAAKRFGAKGVGIEIEDHLVEKARNFVKVSELEDRVEILHGDLLSFDLLKPDWTVIVVCLLPDAFQDGSELRKRILEKMETKGCRIIFSMFRFDGAQPTGSDAENKKWWIYDHTSLP